MSKQKSKTKNKKRRPAWVDMYAKTQKIDARMGDSGDWSTDVPNIKLSRAFVVVLILHVVAVGGILAFEMFKTEPSGDGTAGAEAQFDANQSAGAVKDGVQQPGKSGFSVTGDDGQDDGYMRYIVQSGDSFQFIADAYNISLSALLAANNMDERHPLVEGRRLRIPRAPLSAPTIDLAGTPAVDGVASGATEEESGSGFIPLRSAGVIADAPLGLEAQPEASPAVTTGSSEGDGFLPLGNASQSAGQGTTVSKIVKRPDRPRVLRERPVVVPIESKRLAVSSASRHTVVAGDTLYGVSRKYGVSVKDLLDANPDVTPRTLKIGKTLRIP